MANHLKSDSSIVKNSVAVKNKIRRFLKQHDIKYVRITQGEPAYYRKNIVVSDNAAYSFHEVGHLLLHRAAGYSDAAVWCYAASYKMSVWACILTLILGIFMSSPLVFLPLLLTVPMLLDEGLSSLIGLAVKRKVDSVCVRDVWDLTLAFMTYLWLPLLTAAMVFLLRVIETGLTKS